jgi:hypothetical protein
MDAHVLITKYPCALSSTPGRQVWPLNSSVRCAVSGGGVCHFHEENLSVNEQQLSPLGTLQVEAHSRDGAKDDGTIRSYVNHV